MAHETHHETSNGTEKKSKTSMSASFWFVLILAGLFIAAVNFVNVVSHEPEEGEGAKTEHMHEANSEAAHTEAGEAAATHSATETHSEAAQTTADTAAHAEHH